MGLRILGDKFKISYGKCVISSIIALNNAKYYDNTEKGVNEWARERSQKTITSKGGSF